MSDIKNGHTLTATDLTDGFYYDMPFEQYAAIDAVNGSSIVNMRRSPMYYHHVKENPKEPTPAMILGTATHRMVLEPNRVGDLAVWGNEANQKVRNGKVWDEFKAQNKGKLIVTAKEAEWMLGMTVAARRYQPIRKYADAKGQTEVTMIWTDPATGLRMKGRADKIIPSTHTIADLKTCARCNSRAFAESSYRLGYHIKMAMYWSGYRVLTGKEAHLKLLAVESKEPYESAVYRVTKDVIIKGIEELDDLLKLLIECQNNDSWPAAEQQETDLQLPTWATSNETEEDFALEGLELE